MLVGSQAGRLGSRSLGYTCGWATPGSAGLGVSSQTLSAGAFPLMPSPGLPGVTQAGYQLF